MHRLITKWIGTYINILALIAPDYAGKIGFMTFGRTKRRKIRPNEKKFLKASEQFCFYYKQTKIQAYRWGSGSKIILLLHGWQSHSGRWEHLVHLLKDSDYTVFAFDAPGHGLSDGTFFSAPFYGEIIYYFGKKIGNLHAIVGHSLGGFSTLYAVSHFKQLEVDRLVIIATPGQVKDFINYFKHRLGLSQRSVQCIVNYFEKELGLPHEEYSITRFVDYIDLPGLIIHDTMDRFAPFKYAKQLNKKWANSELIITKGLGHKLSSPEISKNIIDFLNKESLIGQKSIIN